MFNFLKSKIEGPDEEAVVQFGDADYVRPVSRDADGRPYVIICGKYLWIDEAGRSYRRVMWLRRNPALSEYGCREKE